MNVRPPSTERAARYDPADPKPPLDRATGYLESTRSQPSLDRVMTARVLRSAADVSCMAAAAELHGDPQSGLSPELVLVDAALSAEVRHLLVPPGDTIERLLTGRTREARPEEALPLPELAGDGKPEDEVSGNQTLAENPAHWSETLESAAPADGMEDPLNDLAPVVSATEHTHPDELEQARNSYPALPSPSAEGSRNDATETVLRLIAGTSLPAS